ncbi:MARVEL domain-containing protein 3 [Oryzias melastigma]|uniref:MARVEL domain-containing protein 3 n=1 Tax=Oryzias melastigma TaxID=30732 RepID=A0A834BWF7_ORYME|nr:MARVEL domain-containing protein 3 [Oryzias melastigma]
MSHLSCSDQENPDTNGGELGDAIALMVDLPHSQVNRPFQTHRYSESESHQEDQSSSTESVSRHQKIKGKVPICTVLFCTVLTNILVLFCVLFTLTALFGFMNPLQEQVRELGIQFKWMRESGCYGGMTFGLTFTVISLLFATTGYKQPNRMSLKFLWAAFVFQVVGAVLYVVAVGLYLHFVIYISSTDVCKNLERISTQNGPARINCNVGGADIASSVFGLITAILYITGAVFTFQMIRRVSHFDLPRSCQSSLTPLPGSQQEIQDSSSKYSNFRSFTGIILMSNLITNLLILGFVISAQGNISGLDSLEGFGTSNINIRFNLQDAELGLFRELDIQFRQMRAPVFYGVGALSLIFGIISLLLYVIIRINPPSKMPQKFLWGAFVFYVVGVVVYVVAVGLYLHIVIDVSSSDVCYHLEKLYLRNGYTWINCNLNKKDTFAAVFGMMTAILYTAGAVFTFWTIRRVGPSILQRSSQTDLTSQSRSLGEVQDRSKQRVKGLFLFCPVLINFALLVSVVSHPMNLSRSPPMGKFGASNINISFNLQGTDLEQVQELDMQFRQMRAPAFFGGVALSLIFGVISVFFMVTLCKSPHLKFLWGAFVFHVVGAVVYFVALGLYLYFVIYVNSTDVCCYLENVYSQNGYTWIDCSFSISDITVTVFVIFMAIVYTAGAGFFFWTIREQRSLQVQGTSSQEIQGTSSQEVLESAQDILIKGIVLIMAVLLNFLLLVTLIFDPMNLPSSSPMGRFGTSKINISFNLQGTDLEQVQELDMQFRQMRAPAFFGGVALSLTFGVISLYFVFTECKPSHQMSEKFLCGEFVFHVVGAVVYFVAMGLYLYIVTDINSTEVCYHLEKVYLRNDFTWMTCFLSLSDFLVFNFGLYTAIMNAISAVFIFKLNRKVARFLQNKKKREDKKTSHPSPQTSLPLAETTSV